MSGDNISILEEIDPDINHYNDTTVNFKQYSTESFNKEINTANGTLNVFHNNARSLMKEGKIEQYKYLLEELNNPFHILVFTETWLTENNKNLLSLENFSPIHLIRPSDNQFDFKSRGVGVSIFLKHNIDFIIRHDLTVMTPIIECLPS